MNRRAIAILGAIFLLIVLTLSFLIYQKRKSSQAEDPQVQVDQTDDQAQAEEVKQTNKAVKLTDDQVVSPALFFEGDGITYFNRQGQLFRNDLQVSGKTLLLSNKEELPIPLKVNLSKVYWSPSSDNDNFIAESLSNSNKSLSVYVNDRGGYVSLPSNITSIDWAPDGARIYYLWLDNNKTKLFVANADATNYQALADIRENDDKIHVSPDGRFILFYRTTNTEALNKIVSVTSDGKSFKTAVGEGYNIGVKWSPDSKHFLFGKKDPSNARVSLWLGNVETGETRSLDLITTPEKAVWSPDGSLIVAAVPKQSSGSSITDDVFYKIDPVSLSKNTFDPNISVDAEELFLDLALKNVLFKNERDGGLYYLTIP